MVIAFETSAPVRLGSPAAVALLSAGRAGRIAGHRQEPGRRARRFPGDRDGRGARARGDGRHHHLARRLGQERAGRAEREPRSWAPLYLLPHRDKAWFDALPAAEQKALAESARARDGKSGAKCRRTMRA